MVRMPESRRLILNFMASMPVINPAAAPAIIATPIAAMAGHLWTSSTAATAAPVVMVPSAVISGNSKILKLM